MAAAEAARWGESAIKGSQLSPYSGRRWSDADYLVAADPSLTDAEVSAITGRSHSAVRRARQRLAHLNQ